MTHRFHIGNSIVSDCIVYNTNLGHGLMVQVGLNADSGPQILEWDYAVIPMKESRIF